MPPMDSCGRGIPAAGGAVRTDDRARVPAPADMMRNAGADRLPPLYIRHMSALADELLRACLDDDVPLLQAARLTRTDGAVDGRSAPWAIRRDALLSTLAELSARGMIELGDVEGGRFRAWPAAPPENPAARLAGRMPLADLVPIDQPDDQHAAWAFAAWIRTTARGDEAAFGLVERESCLDDGTALAALRGSLSQLLAEDPPAGDQPGTPGS